MNPSQFIAAVVFGASLCLGGLGVSLKEWKKATTSQKTAFINQSRLDQDQKATLVRLVSTTSWPELREALTSIRAEFAIKRNFTRNTDAKKAFADVEVNLGKFLDRVERIEETEKSIARGKELLENAEITKALGPESRARFQDKLGVEEVFLEEEQKEVSDLAQAYLVIAMQRTADANKALAGELNKRSQGYLWGIIASIGGLAMSIGAAFKLFFEVTRLRLECQKLRATRV